MEKRQISIINRLGIHGRSSATIASVARRFSSEIVMSKDGMIARATSPLELMLLCGKIGDEMTVMVEGPDELEAIEAITTLFAGFFGEDE